MSCVCYVGGVTTWQASTAGEVKRGCRRGTTQQHNHYLHLGAHDNMTSNRLLVRSAAQLVFAREHRNCHLGLQTDKHHAKHMWRTRVSEESLPWRTFWFLQHPPAWLVQWVSDVLGRLSQRWPVCCQVPGWETQTHYQTTCCATQPRFPSGAWQRMAGCVSAGPWWGRCQCYWLAQPFPRPEFHRGTSSIASFTVTMSHRGVSFTPFGGLCLLSRDFLFYFEKYLSLVSDHLLFLPLWARPNFDWFSLWSNFSSLNIIMVNHKIINHHDKTEIGWSFFYYFVLNDWHYIYSLKILIGWDLRCVIEVFPLFLSTTIHYWIIFIKSAAAVRWTHCSSLVFAIKSTRCRACKKKQRMQTLPK